jgi:hypothetical protein
VNGSPQRGARAGRALVAVLLVAIAAAQIGCGAVEVRSLGVVKQSPNHPVLILLGQAPLGPLAVALDKGQLALVWPAEDGRLQLIYRAFDEDGPCGSPGPTSYVERGREKISTSCEPSDGTDPRWQHKRLVLRGARLGAASLGDGRLWLAFATKGRASLISLRLPRLQLEQRYDLRVSSTSALALQVVGSRQKPLLAIVHPIRHGGELELFQPSGLHLKLVGRREVERATPLALGSSGAGYVVAANEPDGSLAVLGAVGNDREPRLLRKYPFQATSLAIGDGNGAPLLALSGTSAGRQVFAAGKIGDAASLQTGMNPHRLRALAVTWVNRRPLPVVSEPNPGYSDWLLKGRRDPLRAFATAHWDGAHRRWSRASPLFYDARVGQAAFGKVVLLGGLAAAHDPRLMYKAYVLTP